MWVLMVARLLTAWFVLPPARSLRSGQRAYRILKLSRRENSKESNFSEGLPDGPRSCSVSVN